MRRQMVPGSRRGCAFDAGGGGGSCHGVVHITPNSLGKPRATCQDHHHLQLQRRGGVYNKDDQHKGQELHQANSQKKFTIRKPVRSTRDLLWSVDLSPDVEAAIKAAWEPIVGSDFLVVVAQLAKFKEGGGLGISLEGTVDVEDGVEVRPHHYIRSILPDGPVGLNGRLKSSDELLEVNGRRLLGLNHVSVVEILKDLPQHVRLVCARRKYPLPDSFTAPDMQIPGSLPYTHGVEPGPPLAERLVKAKSEMALSTTEGPPVDTKTKSRSMETLNAFAMWSSQPVAIELEKGEKGLGFSILDYQDPVNPSETVIVIRSLVPGGVAMQDGRLVPGDRLIYVNNVNVEHATLDEAVQALKGAPRGTVKIGVAKPLPISEAFKQESQFFLFNESNKLTNQSPSFAERNFDQSSWTKDGLGGSALALQTEINLANDPDETDSESDSYTEVNDCKTGGLVVEIPSYDVSDSKSLTSDVALSSPETSSVSSSDSDQSKSMRRRDSFYESDEDARTPRRTAQNKSQDLEQPPGYESVSSIYNKLMDEVKVKVTNRSRPDDVATDKFTLVSSSGVAQTKENHHAMLLPSYEEALKVNVETSRVDVKKDASAPIAKQDSTDSDSDQLPTNMSSDVRATRPPEAPPSSSRKTPPPIPPKPKDAKSLLKFAQEKFASFTTSRADLTLGKGNLVRVLNPKIGRPFHVILRYLGALEYIGTPCSIRSDRVFHSKCCLVSVAWLACPYERPLTFMWTNVASHVARFLVLLPVLSPICGCALLTSGL
ncbi:hypothetical protein Btru_076712 [Bulinus truncatus]|nr:hypothetical protein Btru_076712 [Bulinus truncatus]